MKAVFGLIGTAAALALVVPGTAGAASQLYHPDKASREFTTTQGGWEFESDTEDSICIAPLTCPSTEGVYAPSYGASGEKDGFLLTVLDGLTNVGVTTETTWTSPAFTYRGLQGKQPDELVFSMARQVKFDDLIGVEGPIAIQSVKIQVAGAEGRGIRVIDGERLAEQEGWAQIEPVRIDPDRLVIGQQYQIELRADFRSTVDTFPIAGIAYDNVALRATTPPKEPDNGNGGGGGNEGKDLGARIARLLGPTTLRNGKLIVRPFCPHKAAPEGCDLRFTGLMRRGGSRITKTKEFHGEPGKRGVLKVKVKPRFLDKVSERRAISWRIRGEAGGVQVKAVRRSTLKKK